MASAGGQDIFASAAWQRLVEDVKSGPAHVGAALVRDFCTRKTLDKNKAMSELLKIDGCAATVSELLMPVDSPAAAAARPPAAAPAAAQGQGAQAAPAAPPPPPPPPPGVTHPAADAAGGQAAAASGTSTAASAVAEARRKLLEPYAAPAARAEAEALLGAPDPYIGQGDVLDADGPPAAELKRKRAIWKKVNAAPEPPTEKAKGAAVARPLPPKLQLEAYIVTTDGISGDLDTSTFMALSRKMQDDAGCKDEIAYLLSAHTYDKDAMPLDITDCVVLDAKQWRMPLWSSGSPASAKALDMFVLTQSLHRAAEPCEGGGRAHEDARRPSRGRLA